MKRKVKRKRWLDNRSRKLGNKKYAITKKTYRYPTSIKKERKSTSNPLHNVISFTERKIVPSNFSFLNNPEETINYFDELVAGIRDRRINNNFFIDSENVTNVTVDALIYLISIMQNIKPLRGVQHTISGNLPANENLKRIYTESGFMACVQSKMNKLPKNTEKMQIVTGSNNDSTVAANFCNFVMNKLNKKQIEIQCLYKVLIELLSNVYHHAYNNEHKMLKRWYIYAEHVESHIRFVFIDTGAGIPQTVHKKWHEQISRFFHTNASDADLIQSALSGDFRSETQEAHRSNGLSAVRENVEAGLFKNFTVLSGRGCCIINTHSKDIQKYDYKNKIFGTIYIFDIA